MNNLISTENAEAVFCKALEGIICYKPVRNHDRKVIDFIFLSLNDAAVKLLNAPREDFVDKNFLPLFPGSVESGLFNAFVEAAETGEHREIEFHYQDKNYEGWYKDTVIPNEDILIVFFNNITEKKLLEINLAERTKQLEMAKDELSESLKEKEVLLKEIHHRVKNNLQIISSIIHLQRNYIESSESEKIFRDMQSKIQSIALLHQKLYQGNSFTDIDFGLYLKDIIYSIFSTYEADSSRINIKHDIDNFLLGIDNSINLGLILNELITNTIKHAFPGNRKGTLLITIKTDKDVVITVSDDGVGLPEGMDIFKTDTLGMQLITSLTEQINGRISVESANGTTFTILIPCN